jgi:hypothetical protein
VNAAGRYVAPAVVPANNVVTLKAVSKANSIRTGTATVTLVQRPVVIRSVSPNRPAAGKEVELTVTAAGFLATAKIQINGMAWPTTASPSAGTLKAKGTFSAAGTYAHRLEPRPRFDSERPIRLTVTAPASPPAAVTVSVTPGTATVAIAATRQFAATLANSSNTMVTWSATPGTISSTGLYTAPAAMPASPAVTIRATSTSDTTKFATAAVTIQSATPPAPNPGLLSAARLLDQAAFGPTPQSLDEVQSRGAAAWIEDQFNAPESALSLTGDLRAQMLSRLAQAPDQLRQRMVWALSQIS